MSYESLSSGLSLHQSERMPSVPSSLPPPSLLLVNSVESPMQELRMSRSLEDHYMDQIADQVDSLELDSSLTEQDLILDALKTYPDSDERFINNHDDLQFLLED